MPDTTEFLFAVSNHHIASSGKPPSIVDDGSGTRTFRSYFENAFGEQWIFLHNYAEGISRLYSGDCGWEEALLIHPASEVVELYRARRERLIEGNASAESIDLIDRLIQTWGRVVSDSPVVHGSKGPVAMNDAERLWVEACLKVVRPVE